MSSEELCLITVKRIQELQEKEGLLRCLEILGIKNWEIYKQAQDMLEQYMEKPE